MLRAASMCATASDDTLLRVGCGLLLSWWAQVKNSYAQPASWVLVAQGLDPRACRRPTPSLPRLQILHGTSLLMLAHACSTCSTCSVILQFLPYPSNRGRACRENPTAAPPGQVHTSMKPYEAFPRLRLQLRGPNSHRLRRLVCIFRGQYLGPHIHAVHHQREELEGFRVSRRIALLQVGGSLRIMPAKTPNSKIVDEGKAA